MDELIYQFLLQAGYPRAAIVSDASLLVTTRDGSRPADATTYAIVDPETADCLAVIDVVDAIDADQLQVAAARAGRYAQRIGGKIVQGFVVRVDPKGRSDAEQVQFYRVWPNAAIQQLSARTFPDIDGLRVAYLLSLQRSVPATTEIVEFPGDHDEPVDDAEESPGIGAASVMPAVCLMLLAVADWYLVYSRGVGLFNVVQALLAVTAAALLTILAVLRRFG